MMIDSMSEQDFKYFTSKQNYDEKLYLTMIRGKQIFSA